MSNDDLKHDAFDGSEVFNSSKVFEQLEPPPAGLTRLRVRIDEDTRRRRDRAVNWAYGLSSLAAGLVALIIVLRPADGQPPPRANAADVMVDASGMGHAALVQLGLADAPSEPVTIAIGSRDQVAAYRVPSDDDVVFYWVSRGEEPDLP